jgi:hypothetical protein
VTAETMNSVMHALTSFFFFSGAWISGFHAEASGGVDTATGSHVCNAWAVLSENSRACISILYMSYSIPR